VQGLVKKLGGEIECTSAVGATEFKILLPASEVQKSGPAKPDVQETM
jgi:nitrogen-specific signal transduction histidine kinase